MSKTIILIDDDQDDLEIMKEVVQLVQPTFTCISFIFPEEALTILCRKKILIPDFIFIDMNMPVTTGDKCLQEIRKHEEFDRAVITMFSTSMPDKIAANLLRQGANFALQKPSNMNDYHKIVRRITLGMPNMVDR